MFDRTPVDLCPTQSNQHCTHIQATNTYQPRPPRKVAIVDLIASVANAAVPSKDVMAVISDGRSDLPNVDAP